MKKYEKPYLDLLLLDGDVIVSSGTESEKVDGQGESSGNW